MDRLMGDVGSFPRAIRRLALYGLLTLVCIPIQTAALVFKNPLRLRCPLLYHRACLSLLGIKLEVSGSRSQAQPALFVANHAGYLDITILGALVPGSFIAKSEVSLWPLFGVLAKLQRTVFVDRRRDSIRTQRDDIARRLLKGDRLILFPESTSSDGNRVLPFKSALFSVAALDVGPVPLTVQPVSIAYTKLDGIPLGRALRPLLAWYGDMELARHLLGLAGLRRITIAVTFHPPVTLHSFGSRKALSDHCQSVIAAGVSASLTGRSSGAEGHRAPI